MDADIACLKKFADEQSEGAFRELVKGRINFVYGVALRQVGGDSHLAQEVAQNVFIDLARKAQSLATRPNLTGWFYTSTRFAASKALRSRVRRLNHETEAHVMNEILSDDPGPKVAWNELGPVLDAAMDELNENDREAILLRYFEGRAFAEVGAAIGLAENAARMRVDRALEKLRERLGRHGITSTAAALGGAIAAQPAVAAPAGLAVAVAEASLAGLATGGVGAAGAAGGWLGAPKLAALGLVVVLGTGLYLGGSSRIEAKLARDTQQQERTLTQLRNDIARLRVENPAPPTIPAVTAPAVVRAVVDPLDRLRAVAALLKEGSVGRIHWLFGAGFPEVITPSLRDLFALNAAEAESLARHVERAQRDIGAMAVARATVRREGRGIEISVPEIPFVRESYERMCDGFRQTLGVERFALMQEVGLIDALQAGLGEFGLTPSVIRLWHVTNPRLPDYPYALERIQPAEPSALEVGRPGAENYPGSMDFVALKQNLGPFGRLVPVDF